MAVLRTCIGCRSRADKTTLVRLVATGGPTSWVVTPDERGSLPGRGAHLHPDPRCLEQARRRRAFGRALRVEGPIDTGPLDALAETWTSHHDQQNHTRDDSPTTGNRSIRS